MIVLALLLAMPGAAASPAATPPALAQATIEEHPGSPLPMETRFLDQDRRSVRLGELLQTDRPTILVFSYYECPMLCGLVLRGVVDAVRGMAPGDRFNVLTISFDPRDTPERAARKRQSTLIELGRPQVRWPFLTGERPNIDAVTKAVGFRAIYDDTTRQYAHPSAIVVLTPDGRVSRYLYGVSYPLKELKLALGEAEAGRTTMSLTALIMTCFRYDPNTHRYGPYLVGFFRIGSALVLLTVGLFLLNLRRRETAERANE